MPDFHFAEDASFIAGPVHLGLVVLEVYTCGIDWGSDEVIPIYSLCALEEDLIKLGNGVRKRVEVHVGGQSLPTIAGFDGSGSGGGAVSTRSIGTGFQNKSRISGSETDTAVKPGIATAGLDANVFGKTTHETCGSRTLRLIRDGIRCNAIVAKVHGRRAEVDVSEIVAGIGTDDGKRVLGYRSKYAGVGRIGKSEHSITFLSAREVEDPLFRHCALFAIGRFLRGVRSAFC